MKNTLLFTYSTNTLVGLLTVNMTQNCLTPKIMKMCDCMIVTLLKMRPHHAAHPHPEIPEVRPSPGEKTLFGKLWRELNDTQTEIKIIKNRCLALRTTIIKGSQS